MHQQTMQTGPHDITICAQPQHMVHQEAEQHCGDSTEGGTGKAVVTQLPCNLCTL